MNNVIWDYTTADRTKWDTITGGGLYNVVGYPAVSYLTFERLHGLKFALIGDEEDREDFKEACEKDQLEASNILELNNDCEDEGSLQYEEDANVLKDAIANNLIDAVVLLYQDGKLQHLDTVLKTKKPIFHVVDGFDWVGERILFKKAFTKVMSTSQPAIISTSREFGAKEFEAPEVMLEVNKSESPVLYHPSMGEIHAYRGVGKTNLTLGLLDALATGGEFLCYKATRPFRTIDFDGEMDGGDLQESLQLLTEENDNFHMVARCEQPDNFMPSMATEDGLAWYEEAINRCEAEVAVFDNWSTLANIGTNEEEAFFVFTAWARKMRLRGVTVIYLHHDGKDKHTQRGHSKPEDPLNWVIGLTWPPGYEGQEQLKLILKFEKCRKPVREYNKIAITLEPDGTWFWGKDIESTTPSIGRPTKAIAAEQLLQLKQLMGEGKGERAIAEEMKISRDLVRRWKNELLGKKPKQMTFDSDKGENNNE